MTTKDTDIELLQKRTLLFKKKVIIKNRINNRIYEP